MKKSKRKGKKKMKKKMRKFIKKEMEKFSKKWTKKEMKNSWKHGKKLKKSERVYILEEEINKHMGKKAINKFSSDMAEMMLKSFFTKSISPPKDADDPIESQFNDKKDKSNYDKFNK